MSSIAFQGVASLNFVTVNSTGGTLDPTITKKWTATSNNVTSVRFGRGNVSSRIQKMVVSYNKPSDPLKLNSTNPANNAKVESFSSISFNFNGNISSILKPEGVKLSGGKFTTAQILKAGATGSSTISYSLQSEVLGQNGKAGDDGIYTVTAEAGTFKDAQGSLNEAFTRTFEVYAKRTTLVYKNASTVPAAGASGKYEELPIIKLLYDDKVKVDASKSATVKIGSTYKGSLSLSLDPDDPEEKTILLTASSPFRELGNYTIEVPASAIHNQAFGTSDATTYDRWNAAFTLSYTVYREESAAMQEARNLLKNSGIGYPTTTSAAYVNLKNAVEAVDAGGDETGLTDIIAAYKSETTVTLPTSGQYYKIAFNGKYLTYNDGSVGQTTSKNDAYSFLATKSGNTYTLSTTETSAKYLSSASAVSASAVNLTISKGTELGTLSISSISNKCIFEVGTKPSTQGEPTTLEPGVAFDTDNNSVNAGDELILVIISF